MDISLADPVLALGGIYPCPALTFPSLALKAGVPFVSLCLCQQHQQAEFFEWLLLWQQLVE